MSEKTIRLLLVEDNVGDAGLLQAALSDVPRERFPFTLVHVTRAAEAAKSLNESAFDVVLLDLSLPDSQNLDTVARVKEAAPTTPIVIMTGLSDEQVAINAMRGGAQDYLVKGEVDSSMLIRAIRYAIERKKIETQIQQLRYREEVLREINAALTSTLDLESVLNILLGKIIELLPGFPVTIRLKNKETGNFDPVACRNLDERDWKNASPVTGYSGLTQVVMSSGKPVVVTDVQTDPRTVYREFMIRHGLVTFLGIPLIVKGEVLGVLGCWTKAKYEFSEEEIAFFNALGSQAAVAISNSRLFEEVKTANERQKALREFNSAINASLDLRSVLGTLVEKIVDLGSGCACTIRLLNRETGMLETMASRHVDDRDWEKTSTSRGGGLTEAVTAARAPIAVLDLARDPRVRHPDYIRRNGLVSFLGLPLLLQDEFIGVLSIYTSERHDFTHEEVEFFNTLAGQAAAAIHNSWLYERLKSAHAALAKAMEVKSVLMGVMAHELKSPIQVIMGAASLLSEGMLGELTEEQHKRLRNIESGSHELIELIDSTLEMTRLEQGKVALVATEINLRTLLGELESEFRGAFGKKGIELHIKMPPPELTMTTDRLKLKEILRNLLDNARKFTSQGKVSVKCKERDNARVEFVVSDTGVGIPHELLPKVFDLFYQVEPSQKEHASAGMGLNIVKRLVEAMSGEIHVTSEVGRGSTFRVDLPKAIVSVHPD